MWKQYLFGILISLAAGWFFLQVVPLDEMTTTLGQVKLIYLLPNALLYLLSYVFRAIRWHYLMLPLANVRFKPLFQALMVGFLGNNILPAHLGEVVRAYVLGRTEKVSKSATFATVVMERVYDGLTVLFFLLLVMWFMDLPEGRVDGTIITVDALRTGGWLGFALFAGLLVILQCFRWKKDLSLKLVGICLKPLPKGLGQKILTMVDAFADGLAVTRAKDLLFVAIHSLLVWFCLAFWAWSLLFAFGISMSPMVGLLMEVVVALALLIPSAPAFLGTFHLAAAATLSFVGADPAQAGGYAMLLWLIHFVVTTLVGLYFVWRMGLGWKAFSGKA
ncbi:lysylphosphatidylglycerol synthase transmembrane domain-containing protein [Dethiosulfatarculus sandiegensis]|uniref:Lysylphosphatidylglycerol synthetase n=1 Tax=Dethiosulfatarculus sandiegensis TaxID=1429043 RepID=A0A0D2HSC9_9BACT|nr:lysylphosphatidylglycerol synthase transmembrane domain-containing protein [Dethiosulfatarculus sandiegensis]KIX13428.1 hypothetical protein X474_14340 [Dethiosulfatarculus sandiegensis]